MQGGETAVVQVKEHMRLARLAEAAATASAAYGQYAETIAGIWPGQVGRRDQAERAWREAHTALEALAKREGYRAGDHVRIKAGGAFHGATGVLTDGSDGWPPQPYHFGLRFDVAQRSEESGRAVRSCMITVDTIGDIT